MFWNMNTITLKNQPDPGQGLATTYCDADVAMASHITRLADPSTCHDEPFAIVASWQHLVQAATARGRHGGVAVAVESPSSVADVRDSRIESTQVTSSRCSEEHCFSQAEDSTSVATATPPPSPPVGSENENMMFVCGVLLRGGGRDQRGFPNTRARERPIAHGRLLAAGIWVDTMMGHSMKHKLV